MQSNFKLLWASVAGVSFILSGCSNNDVSPIENITIVEEGTVTPAQKAESSQPTAILGSGGSISGLLSRTFIKKVEPQNAKHVIVACDDLDTYESEIIEAYGRGAVITVVDPDGSKLEDWCASKDMVYPGDPMTTNTAKLVSFNRKAVSISIQKKKKGKDDVIEEEEVPLVIFTGWLDDILIPSLNGIDFRSRDIRKRFIPQSVSHVFPIDIPAEVLKESGWGVPESLSLNTTAELKCDIYPLHSFAENASFTGDLYAVEAVLTIHNADIYNGRWQYSQGGKQYESSGFYLSNCGLGVSLYEKVASGVAHSGTHVLAAGPTPVSTQYSSSLQTGFEWKFNGWLTGGNGLESDTPTPLQEGGWTWNNIVENVSSEISIDTMTEGGDIFWTLSLPQNEDNTSKPTMSGDLTFRCSWIWAVPQATDDSTGRYYMNVDMAPVYRWLRCVLPSGGVESKDLILEVPSSCFLLIPPSRSEGQRI